jgi:hypothetical protein
MALQIATDPDYRFELAVQLGKLEDAVQIVQVLSSFFCLIPLKHIAPLCRTSALQFSTLAL